MAIQPLLRVKTPGSGLHWFCRAAIAGAAGYAIVAGGPITRAAGVAAAVLALLADFDGLTRHAFRAFALAAAAYAAPLFGPTVGAWISSRTGFSAAVGGACGLAVAGIAVLVVLGVCGRVAGALVRRSRLARFDRAAGALIGFGEGIAVVVVACWSAVTFGAQLDQMKVRSESAPWTRPVFAWIDAFRAAMADDPLAQIAVAHNPLPDVPIVRTTQRILEVATDPSALERFSQSDALREFVELPVVKKHLEAIRGDPALRHAVEQRNVAELMGSPQFAAMMNDGELHSALSNNFAKVQSALTAADPRPPVPTERTVQSPSSSGWNAEARSPAQPRPARSN